MSGGGLEAWDSFLSGSLQNDCTSETYILLGSSFLRNGIGHLDMESQTSPKAQSGKRVCLEQIKRIFFVASVEVCGSTGKNSLKE